MLFYSSRQAAHLLMCCSFAELSAGLWNVTFYWRQRQRAGNVRLLERVKRNRIGVSS